MVGRTDVSELVALIDRLESLLERSELTELELEVAGTTIILRSQAAVVPASASAPAGVAPFPVPEPVPPEHGPAEDYTAHAVVAPLTGVYYRSPSPGAEPYVRDGGPVNVGQVIGLIEAMKLFNEIKSDVTGTVRRFVAGDGDLVKAKQTLIEVDVS